MKTVARRLPHYQIGLKNYLIITFTDFTIIAEQIANKNIDGMTENGNVTSHHDQLIMSNDLRIILVNPNSVNNDSSFLSSCFSILFISIYLLYPYLLNNLSCILLKQT